MSVMTARRESRLDLCRRTNSYRRRQKARRTLPQVRLRVPLGSFLRLARTGATVALGAAFFLALSVALLVGYRYATSNAAFSLAQVAVTGTERLSYEDVLASTGLKKGVNVVALNMREVRSSLLRNPWIKAVAVRRQLPDSLAIAITERAPSFWVLPASEDGAEGVAPHYADMDGTIIAPVTAEHFTSLPLLNVAPGGEAALRRLSELLTLYEREGPGSQQSLDWRNASSVGCNLQCGLEIHFEASQAHARDLTLCIGLGQYARNVHQLTRALRDLRARGEWNTVTALTATDDRVIVSRG